MQSRRLSSSEMLPKIRKLESLFSGVLFRTNSAYKISAKDLEYSVQFNSRFDSYSCWSTFSSIIFSCLAPSSSPPTRQQSSMYRHTVKGIHVEYNLCVD